ncbi:MULTISPECIES: hypothetical protein [Chryseobacterium]|uniref:Uncharacterized protein n=1 Tax=Candidatus Chryseobacterium massiliense TaxID=204089 RepID=A0A3D9AER8_9FLAO|nr:MULTISPECIES: hypothetical protein [Chryseobacterium]REC39954.1 hypothetical protein DRF68_20635 [Candidatus Chryseobacterium massiliae]
MELSNIAIKKQLLEKGLIQNSSTDLRIDILDKQYLIGIYQLRLENSIEMMNQSGIDFCRYYLKNLQKSRGNNILSISFRKNNGEMKSFFSDEYLHIIWE